jgi:hypothetical protein
MINKNKQNVKFIEHISESNELHVEKISKLIYEIVFKTELVDFRKNFEKTKIIKKGVLIFDFINEKSKTTQNKGSFLNIRIQN